MRHRKKTSHLDRNSQQRKALLKNLANSLILYEKIKTTEAKAKVLKPLVEKMITRAKTNTLHQRRELMKQLPRTNAVKKLMEVVGPKYAARKGGYLRLNKIGPRRGDGAPMAIIEFV